MSLKVNAAALKSFPSPGPKMAAIRVTRAILSSRLPLFLKADVLPPINTFNVLSGASNAGTDFRGAELRWYWGGAKNGPTKVTVQTALY